MTVLFYVIVRVCARPSSTLHLFKKPALIGVQSLRTIQLRMIFDRLFPDTKQPLPPRRILQLTAACMVAFALLAGYYQARLSIWRDNHLKVLQKFEVYTTKELLEKKVEVQ